MDNAYLQQVYKNIQNLLMDGKLEEAYIRCNQILQKVPGSGEFKDLKEDISEKLTEKNEKVVDEGLGKAKAHIKEKKEEKALQVLRNLIKISPNNKKVAKLYLKTEQKYLTKIKKTEIDFVKAKDDQFKEYLEKGEFEKFLQEVDQLGMNYVGNRAIQGLVQRQREELIRQRIMDKSDLLNSDKFEDIDHFIKDLKRINKDSHLIAELARNVYKKRTGSQIDSITNFIYSGTRNIESLMKLGKYSAAYKASRELLKTNPGNKKAVKLYRKAKKASYARNRDKAVKEILSKLPARQKDLEENKEMYVRI